MHPVEVNLPLEKRIKKRNFLKSDYALVKDIDDHFEVAQRLCNYIEQVHNIVLPEDFMEKLVNAHCKFNRFHSFYMDYKHVDAIVTACEVWEDYIAPGEFNKLLCSELLSFAKIHTSVIQAPKIQSVQCVRLAVFPDYRFATIVSQNGDVARCF